MALIQPTVNQDGSLLLEAPNMIPLTVSPIAENRQRLSLKVWADESAGFDQGDEAAAWLTAFLGVSCRLMCNDREFTRLTKLTKPNGESARVAFADGYPLLVISQESLTDLNDRLENQVLMSRFRPSIVLSGLGPYGEDRCSQLSSPEIVLHAAKPCPRCVLITIDQESGATSAPEPLRTLSNYRHNGEKVLFGYYFLPDSPGDLRVGNTLRANLRA
jgi:uncharacterized protein YcbX